MSRPKVVRHSEGLYIEHKRGKSVVRFHRDKRGNDVRTSVFAQQPKEENVIYSAWGRTHPCD